MSVPTNTKLYNLVKKEASLTFKRYPSIYASSWIVREYKKRGGTYSGKISKKIGLSRWFREQWVQVETYLKNGKTVNCGDNTLSTTKACRPLIRINKQTPITLPELLKIHTPQHLIQLARRKQKDMKGRVRWKIGRFYPS